MQSPLLPLSHVLLCCIGAVRRCVLSSHGMTLQATAPSSRKSQWKRNGTRKRRYISCIVHLLPIFLKRPSCFQLGPLTQLWSPGQMLLFLVELQLLWQLEWKSQQITKIHKIIHNLLLLCYCNTLFVIQTIKEARIRVFSRIPFGTDKAHFRHSGLTRPPS